MADTNANRARKNITSQLLYQMLVFLFGLITPRLVIVNLGSESNGLLGSINQALVYLSLLEGGVGLTVSKSMYGPVAQDNRYEVNGILSAAHGFFSRVGVFYLVGIVAIAIIFPFTIRTTLSPLVVMVVVLLTALPGAINFFLLQHYRILISVSGRNYVITRLTTVTYIASSVAKIALLLSGFGLIAVQTLYFLIQFIHTVYILWYVKKTWPWLDLSAMPLKDRIGSRTSVFIHQIAGYVFSSTDMLILTYFCNLKVTSVYAVYTMICTAVNGLSSIFINSFTFFMGQKFNSDIKEYRKMHSIYETCNMVIGFILIFVLYQCLTPFMTIYTRNISDIQYVDLWLPVLFSAVYLLQAGRYSSQKVIEFAGEFKNTQPHALCEAIINLTVSIFSVIRFGIYGVLFGTIAALLVRNVLMIRFACKNILHISPTIYYKKWACNFAVFAVLSVACNLLDGMVSYSTYIELTLYATALSCVATACFVCAVWFYDRDTLLFLKAVIVKTS